MKDSKSIGHKDQNTHKGAIRILFEKEDLSLACVTDHALEQGKLVGIIHPHIIHFYFCLEGSAVFVFSPHYSREIGRQKNYFFYNPEKEIPFEMQLMPGTKMVFMTISLESLHHLFVADALPILRPENINRKFYDERDIPSSLLIVLNQLFNVQLSEGAQKLFYHGKLYELLSLYFSNRKPDMESCPFLNDEATVRKIKLAKEHLLRNKDTPPGLRELAKVAGLNEYQLKVGFKEIYGNTVFGFLLDHKLDHARLMLDSGQYQVNEVAYEMGYANPSHFIAAFKKKFGITAKQYMMRKQG